MKKLVYFCHSMAAGGIESFLVNVFNNIDRCKYDITVVLAIEPEWETLHEKELRDLGIRIIHICDLDGIKKKIFYFKSIYKLMKAEKFDVAHGNIDLLNGAVLTLAKFAGVKSRICHAHKSKTQYHPQGRFKNIKSFLQKMYRKVMQNMIFFADAELLACSTEAAQYFYDDKPTTIIYNGIDIEKYTNATFTEDKLSKYRIVSVGRLALEKNPLFALEVVSELKKLREGFSYTWVGDGLLLDDCKKKQMNLKYPIS